MLWLLLGGTREGGCFLVCAIYEGGEYGKRRNTEGPARDLLRLPHTTRHVRFPRPPWIRSRTGAAASFPSSVGFFSSAASLRPSRRRRDTGAVRGSSAASSQHRRVMALRLDSRGYHSARLGGRKPTIKAAWCTPPTEEPRDECGRVFKVGNEINVKVATWDVDTHLKVGDAVYLTGAGALKPAELAKIEGFHEEVAPADPDDVGIWMQLRILWRPETTNDLPHELELHEREVFLHKGDASNCHTRELELQAQPFATLLHTPTQLADAPHTYFYRRTFQPADPPKQPLPLVESLPGAAAAEGARAEGDGAEAMDTEEAAETAEPATAKAPRRNALREVDALRARVDVLETKEAAQAAEIADLHEKVTLLMDLLGRVTELENRS